MYADKTFLVFTDNRYKGVKMKPSRSLGGLVVLVSLLLSGFLAVPSRTAVAAEGNVAIQRGYRTGYSDGYMAGYRDSIDNAARSYAAHGEYFKADRAYSKDYGDIDDYRDGYQQGFETGYDAGFEKRSFEAAIPSGLSTRGIRASAEPIKQPVAESAKIPSVEAPISSPATDPAPAVPAESPANATSEIASSSPSSAAPQQSVSADDNTVIVIPRDTELIVELNDPISTQSAREGDKFTARVVSPAEVSGATIEGRVEKIERPGRIKKRSQMLLSFDRIVVSESRWSNFDAILSEVLPVKGDNVRRVDSEGTAVGKSTVKPDAIKIGASTGTGLTIGTLTAGPLGAAVGAGIGAAFGLGAIIIEKGKDIKLNSSQQLRIRSSYETKIR